MKRARETVPGAGAGAGAGAAAAPKPADDFVTFELSDGSVRCKRDAFEALPDSMPGRLLASADFAAGRRVFSFKEECSRKTDRKSVV